MNTKLTTALALAGLLAAGTLGSARAASREEDRDAAALKGAKVSLIQAITMAEQQTGGRGFDAGVDTKFGQTRIAVEINGPRGVQTMTIDAQSRQIVGTHADGEQD